MNMFGCPVLKIRTKDRLHITREPGFLSWATLVTVSSLLLALSHCLIPVFLIPCLLLGLNLMETWDLIMDREENLVTLVSRSWHHGFSMRVPEENVKRFPLSCITSVAARPEIGIDIVKNDGSLTRIKSEWQDARSLRRLRREIATFLHLERIEYITGKDKVFFDWDFDPWGRDWPDNLDADAETSNGDDDDDAQESPHEYGRNIKVIKGPL